MQELLSGRVCAMKLWMLFEASSHIGLVNITKELFITYLFFLALVFVFFIKSNGTSHLLAFIKLLLFPVIEKLSSSPTPSGISGITLVAHLSV